MNINFIEVRGEEIYKNFFDENGKVCKESEIESEYNNAHVKATTFAVKPIKVNVKRGTTDGVMILNNDIEVLQECKRNIKNRNTKAYKYHVLQSICYHVQMPKKKKQVIMIDCDQYIDLIYMDENSYDENVFMEALRDNPPSKACKKIDFDITTLKIHTRNMPNMSITDVWKDINNHFNV